MKEKRRHKRITVEGIYGNVLFTTKADIINISLGGAALRVSRNLAPGKEFSLKLQDKFNNHLDLKGIVVWSVLSSSQKGPHGDVVPLYHVGVKFSEVLNDKSKELLKFIEEHRIKGAEDRLRGLRFKIHTPGETILYYPANYKVKLISPYGMLMETTQSLKQEEKFPMEIFLSDNSVIRFVGRIASCIELKDKHPIHYDIGVEFMEINKEDKPHLEAYIRSIYSEDQ